MLHAKTPQAYFLSCTEAADAADLPYDVIRESLLLGEIAGAFRRSNRWIIPVDGMRGAGYDVDEASAVHMLRPSDAEVVPPVLSPKPEQPTPAGAASHLSALAEEFNRLATENAVLAAKLEAAQDAYRDLRDVLDQATDPASGTGSV